jgi:hypothetical protein
VRVVQRGRVLGLAAEAPQEPGVVGERAVQHLHRDPTAQSHVVGDVHTPGRTRTDGTEQAVPASEDAPGQVGNGGAGHPRHGTAALRAIRGSTAACSEGNRRSQAGTLAAMAGSGSPSAPTVIAPERAPQRKLVEHPGRVAIVIGTLAVVIALVAVALNRSDTDTRNERIYPTAVQSVTPRPGELIRQQDTVVADLRDGLTGVLVLSGPGFPTQEIPLDQLEIVKPLSQIAFRPGPGRELQKFEPGEWTATVRYWIGTQNDRPAQVGSYGWRFRVGA